MTFEWERDGDQFDLVHTNVVGEVTHVKPEDIYNYISTLPPSERQQPLPQQPPVRPPLTPLPKKLETSNVPKANLRSETELKNEEANEVLDVLNELKKLREDVTRLIDHLESSLQFIAGRTEG